MCCAELLQLHPTLQRYGPQSARLLCPRDSPGKNTGVVSQFGTRYSPVSHSQSEPTLVQFGLLALKCLFFFLSLPITLFLIF